MQLILTLLRILGILILAILLLVLLVVLLVLICPVRYRVKIRRELDRKPEGRARAFWLLGLLSVRIVYQETLSYRVSLLGIPVRRSEDLFAGGGREKTQEKDGSSPEGPETEQETGHTEDQAERGSKTEGSHQPVQGHQPELSQPEGQDRETEKDHRTEQAQRAARGLKIEQAQPAEQVHRLAQEQSTEQKQKAEQAQPAEQSQGTEQEGSVADMESQEKPEASSTLADKITALVERLAELLEKLAEFLEKLAEMPDLLLEKLEAFTEKKDRIFRLLRDEQNQTAVKAVFGTVGALLRHIRPQKLTVAGRLGFDDPSVTGQVFGIIGMLMPIYGEHIQLEAVFDRAVVEGQLEARGRIRIGHILILALKLIMKKETRRLIAQIKRLKKA